MLDALLTATEHGQVTDMAARDRTTIILLYDTGMRMAELCGIPEGFANSGWAQCPCPCRQVLRGSSVLQTGRLALIAKRH
jgi:hypothetical protein